MNELSMIKHNLCRLNEAVEELARIKHEYWGGKPIDYPLLFKNINIARCILKLLDDWVYKRYMCRDEEYKDGYTCFEVLMIAGKSVMNYWRWSGYSEMASMMPKILDNIIEHNKMCEQAEDEWWRRNI